MERKYALTKIAAGDYLLPSNDAKTIWRIATYEDGPSRGIDAFTRDRTFWGLWRWREEVGVGGYVDTTDWERWDMVGGMYETRAEAMGDALRITSRVA